MFSFFCSAALLLAAVSSTDLNDKEYDKIVNDYFNSVTDETPAQEIIQFIIKMKLKIVPNDGQLCLSRVMVQLRYDMEKLGIRFSDEEFLPVYETFLKRDLIEGKKSRHNSS